MYRCCVHFYLVGWEKQDAELVKGIPPLESFSHVFAESPRPEQELAAAADVILADLRKLDAVETVSSLAAARREGSQLIALAEARGAKNAAVMYPVRIAVSGKAVTPGGAVEICSILGREETLKRLETGISRLTAALGEAE